MKPKFKRFRVFSIIGISLLASIGVLSGISFSEKEIDKVEAGTSATISRVHTVWLNYSKYSWVDPYISYQIGSTWYHKNKMTNDGTNVAKYDLPANVVQVIFSHGSGWNGADCQTPDTKMEYDYDRGSGCCANYFTLNNRGTNLYGAWSYNTGMNYKITFKANGGSGTDVTTTNYLDNCYLHDNADKHFTRTGYNLDGWNTKADGTGTNYSLGEQRIYANSLSMKQGDTVTLYAKWSAIPYTVTLNKQEGTGGIATITAYYGSAMTTITTPTKVGYTFAGYWDDKTSGTQYYLANGTSARTWDKTSDTTLYAHWSANTNTPYTVNHYKQTTALGSNYEKAETDNLTGTTGANTNAAAKTYTGFTNKAFSQSPISGEGTTVVNIYYDRNPLTLKFDSDGGSQVSDKTIYYGAPIGTLPQDPTRDGFTFSGWYTEKDGQGTQITGASSFTTGTTVYAYWLSDVTYITMTFLPGSHSSETGSAQDQAIEGEQYALPNAKFNAAEGYIFSGWEDENGTFYNPGDLTPPVTEEMTFTQQYIENYAIQITHTNGTVDYVGLEFDGQKGDFKEAHAFGVTVQPGDHIKPYNRGASGTKTFIANLDNASKGNWQYNHTEEYLIGDETVATDFDFILKLQQGNDLWYITYNDPDQPIVMNVYIGGSRKPMIYTEPTAQQKSEGIDNQYEYDSNILVNGGTELSFKSNDTQVDLNFYRDEYSNLSPLERDVQVNKLKTKVAANIKIYLKHYDASHGNKWVCYVTGLETNNEYNLIIEPNENTGDFSQSRILPLTEGKDEWGNTQYELFGKQVKVGEKIYVYHKYTVDGVKKEDYFNFHTIQYNGSKYPGAFDTNTPDKGAKDAICKKEGSFNFFVKTASGNNQIYIVDGTEDYEVLAENFAIDFNTRISEVCVILVEGGSANLKAAWDAQKTAYQALDSNVKLYFDKTKTSQKVAINDCLVKYDYVFTKYYGTIFTETTDDFMERFRKTEDHTQISIPPRNMNRNYLLNNDDGSSSTVLIIIISSISLLTLAGASLLIIKKRKH